MAWIKTRYGDVEQMSPQEARNALDTGGSHASKEEIEAELKKQYYGSAGQQVQAGVEAGARGLSLGLTDYLLSDKKGALARREANPITAGLLETGASIGSILATGGAGAVAKGGLKGALKLTPASLVGRASLGLEKKIATGLAKKGLAGTVVKDVAAKGAALGTAGAFEGAAAGLAEIATEHALGDPDLTAESALDTFLVSTAGGLGIGAGLGVVGGGVSAGFNRAKSAFDSALSQTDNPVGKLFERNRALTGAEKGTSTALFDRADEVRAFRQSFPEYDEILQTRSPETVNWALDNSVKLKQAEALIPGASKALLYGNPEVSTKLLDNFDSLLSTPKALDDLAEELRGSLQKSVDAIAAAKNEGYKTIRPKEMLELGINSINYDKVAARTGAIKEDLDYFIRFAEQGPGWDASALQTAKDISERLDISVRPGRVNDKDFLVKFRQSLEDTQKEINKRLQLSKAASPDYNKTITALKEKINKPMKSMLRDPDVWGEYTARYNALQAAEGEWTEFINPKGSDKVQSFYKNFMKKGRYEGHVDGDKILRWLKQVKSGSNKGSRMAEAIDGMLSTGRQYIDELENSINISKIENIDSKAWKQVLEDTADARIKAAKQSELTDAFNELQGFAKQAPMPSLAAQPSAAATALDTFAWLMPGMSVLGPLLLQRAVRYAGKAAANVPRSASTLSHLRSTRNYLESKISKTAVQAVKNAGRKTARGAKTAAIFAIPKNNKESTMHIDRVIQQHNSEKIQQSLQGMSSYAPETTSAAQSLIAKRQEMLLSDMPKSKKVGLIAQELPLSHDQRKDLVIQTRVMTNLSATLNNIASGEFDPVEIKAFKRYWPAVYGRLSNEMIESAIQNHSEMSRQSILGIMQFTSKDVDGTLLQGVDSQQVYATAKAEEERKQIENQQVAQSKTRRRMTDHTRYMRTRTQELETEIE